MRRSKGDRGTSTGRVEVEDACHSGGRSGCRADVDDASGAELDADALGNDCALFDREGAAVATLMLAGMLMGTGGRGAGGGGGAAAAGGSMYGATSISG